ncbi:Brix domain-containing protein [Caenorhabditis elegans]|uniref:Brix domain-containing protein n=1 Tax=Caenorhabditis elegans TaxID=6239 RepID=H2L0R7_CAEEL|nr:Brix domain-containing protein [Caenorhabditis elegans]CCD74106.1 Brix domain-containing protein [Caenorhabditis elegans]|eukprot:NP_741345.2 Uncharacterized protein CELE_Y69A2AR.1 [Caenorhabditis elegans]
MDREGSSKSAEEEKPKEPVVVEKASGEPKKAEDPTTKKRPRKNEDDAPETSDDEDQRAETAGSRNYPANLWNRLKNPPANRPTIDVWEFKLDGEVLTMTFTCDGEKYPMYFTPRSVIDFQMRNNYWIPRHNNTFKSLRTRLYSLPKTVSINKLVFSNTPECEAEDCLIELMFIKKWTCKQLDYNICTEFNQPQHLRRLVHMFKPTDITVSLHFGPYIPSATAHEPNSMHNHLAALSDTTLAMEKDFRLDCAHALSLPPDSSKKELGMLYGEAGKGRAFGIQMLRTLTAIRKFVGMMAEKRMAQTKGVAIRKFVVNGPGIHDKPCAKLQQLLKEDGLDEANKMRGAYATGERVYVCVRNDLRRAFKYSLAMPATAFKMSIGNEQLLLFTKSVPVFHCFFRTNVDEQGVVQLITEWQKGERNIEEIQLHLDRVIEPNFVDHLNADHADPKRVKVRRVVNGRKTTLYIERDRLGSRHLALRTLDTK